LLGGACRKYPRIGSPGSEARRTYPASLDGIGAPLGNVIMANVLKRTDRLVYVRCVVPRETFDALCSWLGENYALRDLRLEWERGITRVASGLPPAADRRPRSDCQ
jgi:hypothetical protein